MRHRDASASRLRVAGIFEYSNIRERNEDYAREKYTGAQGIRKSSGGISENFSGESDRAHFYDHRVIRNY